MGSIMNLDVGDLVRLTTLKNTYPTAQVTFGAPRGKVFIALFLGVEPKDMPGALNAEEVLGKMGWIPKPAPKPKRIRKSKEVV